jgi:hypothetical protein
VQVLLRPRAHTLESFLESSPTEHGATGSCGDSLETTWHDLLPQDLLREFLEFRDAFLTMPLREVLAGAPLWLDKPNQSFGAPMQQR